MDVSEYPGPLKSKFETKKSGVAVSILTARFHFLTDWESRNAGKHGECVQILGIDHSCGHQECCDPWTHMKRVRTEGDDSTRRVHPSSGEYAIEIV
jgi:hypothetical protein